MNETLLTPLSFNKEIIINFEFETPIELYNSLCNYSNFVQDGRLLNLRSQKSIGVAKCYQWGNTTTSSTDNRYDQSFIKIRKRQVNSIYIECIGEPTTWVSTRIYVIPFSEISSSYSTNHCLIDFDINNNEKTNRISLFKEDFGINTRTNIDTISSKEYKIFITPKDSKRLLAKDLVVCVWSPYEYRGATTVRFNGIYFKKIIIQ